MLYYLSIFEKTLAQSEWTHTAHIAVSLCLERYYPEYDIATLLPRLIYDYNESVGITNSDTGGYHETITHFYIQLIQYINKQYSNEPSLNVILSKLMASPFGDTKLPLQFYSSERLFSVEARRKRVEPDIRPLDFNVIGCLEPH